MYRGIFVEISGASLNLATDTGQNKFSITCRRHSLTNIDSRYPENMWIPSPLPPIDKPSILVTVAFSALMLRERVSGRYLLGIAGLCAGTVLMVIG